MSSKKFESLSKAEVVTLLGLVSHPEGGFYKQTWRSAVPVNASDSIDDNEVSVVCGTSIFFLLGVDDKSHLHILTGGNDEMWHHYAGRALDIFEIDKNSGTLKVTTLGKDVMGEQSIQHLVPAGAIFGSQVSKSEEEIIVEGEETRIGALHPEDGWALVGCTVCPGFEFQHFEMPTRTELLLSFPQHREVIERLTRPE